MTWPQASVPDPPPASTGGPPVALLSALITVVAGVLTFLFSFVRIYKIDATFGDEVGRSVWTLEPGLFGVGTLIPFLALVAAGLAALRTFAKGFDDKRLLEFSLAQLQLVAAVFAFVLWLGYAIGIALADGSGFDYEFGLGSVLLFLGTVGVLVGSVLGVLGDRVATMIGRSPDAPATPGSPPAAPASWTQPQPPAGARPGEPAVQQQWPQPATPPPEGFAQQPAPGPAPGTWPAPAEAPAATPSWDPFPTQPTAAPPGGYPNPAAPQPWDQPAPPLPPRPQAPDPGGGGLFDPGTQVIPGPPPAPPPDELRPPPADGPPPPPPPPPPPTP